MKRLFALLALCLPIYLFSQGFGSFTHDQPYFAKDVVGGGASFVPFAYSNLFRWWHSEDLPVGVVVSNQWADRIVGQLMEQGNASVRPTNTTTGVHFDGNTWLTNTPIPLADLSWKFTYGFVMKIDPARAYAGTAPEDIWFGTNNANGTLGLTVVHVPGPGRFSFTDRNFGTAFSVGLCPSNQWFDLLLHQWSYYTNGVVDVENPGNNRTYSGEMLFGFRGGASDFRLRGYVRDILIWTNALDTTSNVLSAVLKSNIHYNFTNYYQYSP